MAATQPTTPRVRFNTLLMDAKVMEAGGNLSTAVQKLLAAHRTAQEDPQLLAEVGAQTMNDVGRVYLMLGRLDSAQHILENIDFFNTADTALNRKFNMAHHRENLGKLWEMKGDLGKAKEFRERKVTDIICSNYHCPMLRIEHFRATPMIICRTCQSIYYCGRVCQAEDYPRHILYCRNTLAQLESPPVAYS
ncbi:uncharacterized protein PAC_07101 [Phialocephala subalpina]|uniref:MYND-type domain-containing protein n=1 Tax=Phialocephala subalpina TaxID=576137 RepID=A0A1L7WWR9_9HELO|nr:uncharacterized protein PAC_07101 [Phialocephala subalpina]